MNVTVIGGGNIGTYLLFGLIDSMSLSAKNFCLSASVCA